CGDIAPEPGAIDRRVRPSADRDLMRYVAYGEGNAIEPGRKLDGCVSQLIVAGRAEARAGAWQRGGDLPARGRLDRELTGLMLTPYRIDEQGRTVQEGMVAIDVAGSHGELVRVHLIAKRNLGCVDRLDHKGLLVTLATCHALAGARIRGRERAHVARVIANKI